MRVVRVLIYIMCIVVLTSGTPFTKPSRHGVSGRSRTETAPAAACDTIWAPPRDSVAVAGFEKTLRSTRESMYVTNYTSGPVEGIGIEITYTDMNDRMLHKASHHVGDGIPWGETRMIEVPSFDRQGLYYYHRSPVPQRTSQATPFKVRVAVLYILIPKTEKL